MKNNIKELTEGMQRLCAVANRVVSAGGKVSPIERDLLLEDLRRLYDVALRLGGSQEDERQAKEADAESAPEWDAKMPDDEMLSSTVMATMAAMGIEHREEPTPEEPVAEEPVAEPQPVAEEPAREEQPAVEEPEVEAAAPAAEEEPKLDLSPETVIVPEPEREEEPAEAAPSFMEAVEPAMGMLLFDEVLLDQQAPETPETPAEPEPVVPETPAEPEPETPEIPETPEPEVSETPEQPETVEPQPAATQSSLLDYLKRPVEEQPTVRTLGDMLGGMDPTKGAAVGGKKVSDLRTVININDKFSFMSELFHNNMRAYNDFILHLNGVVQRDEAMAYVQEVAAQYKWDEESVAVQSFYKVLDKKF